MKHLTIIDILTFSSVLFATLFAIYIGNTKKSKESTDKKSLLDHLLMGRQLTLPLFVATLVATWYGGIFGVTEIAFKQGIFNFVTQGVFWYLSYLIFAFFLAEKVNRSGAATLPELIENIFGKKAAKIAAIFNFFNVVPIAYTISLGIFAHTLFGVDQKLAMLGGVMLVSLYSMFGGFRAVVFTDMVQFFVMCSSVVILLLISIYTYGGIDFLQANLPESHFSPTGNEGWLTTIAWGFIALATLVDPNFYQRCFAAKSPKVAKKGILISTVIWIIFDLSTTFGAMYARATMPDIEPSTGYLSYALATLPQGLKGYFLAGILATILSTMDSYLFVAGTTISYDLFGVKEKKGLRIHHLSVFAVGLISFALALCFEGDIKTVWKLLGSYFSACLLIPVILGIFWRQKRNEWRFISASLLGIIVVSYFRLMKPEIGGIQIDELYAGMLSSLIIFLVPQKLLNFRQS